MTNYVGVDGLHVETLTEIVDNLETQFKAIYGSDINLDSNSPDAQALRIFAEAKQDMLDAIKDVYNSFNPETATGVSLRQRCAINGVVPRGATYTRTYVTITTDRILTLDGLDTAPTAPFTVADTAGVEFYLEETAALADGANTLIFRAANAGQVETTIGTITELVTIILGVLSANNASSAITTGTNEETDPELRLRRQRSVALPSTGWLEAFKAALNNTEGVIDSVVYENNTSDDPDTNGVPAHSIWAIVDGGTDAAVADAIYRKRNAGCGMKGSEEVEITQIDGPVFTAKFDRPVYEDLYIELTLTTVDGEHVIDETYLKNGIYQGILYGIYEPSDISEITALVKGLDPLAVVTAAGVSADDTDYFSFLYPSTIQSRFLISVDRISTTVI
jgi:uncharacterized phage protein gp47/JayE